MLLRYQEKIRVKFSIYSQAIADIIRTCLGPRSMLKVCYGILYSNCVEFQ